MEIVTSKISKKTAFALVKDVMSYLKLKEINKLAVSFGFGCENVEKVIELYKDIIIRTNRVLDYLKESIEKKYFDFGKGNLYIKSKEIKTEFLLCHEGDIHCETTNKDIQAYFEELLKNKGVEYQIATEKDIQKRIKKFRRYQLLTKKDVIKVMKKIHKRLSNK